MKKVFTTGKVAKICKVAPRTVCKWFDSGQLRGYRIPGSQDRRIPEDSLIQFLGEHGMSKYMLSELGSVLIVAVENSIEQLELEVLNRTAQTLAPHTAIAHGFLEAGIQFAQFHPKLVWLVARSTPSNNRGSPIEDKEPNPALDALYKIAQTSGCEVKTISLPPGNQIPA